MSRYEDEEGLLVREVRRLIDRRIHDGHFVARLAWTVLAMLAMTFGWITITLIILSESHWTVAGLIGADGAILLVGTVVLLLTWVPEYL